MKRERKEYIVAIGMIDQKDLGGRHRQMMTEDMIQWPHGAYRGNAENSKRKGGVEENDQQHCQGG